MDYDSFFFFLHLQLHWEMYKSFCIFFLNSRIATAVKWEPDTTPVVLVRLSDSPLQLFLIRIF